ncbi:histone H1 [Mucilaginibacter sp. UYCu711]|uniref:histone H1 n=1 Tax=Mucilaginibacter sp. UYCu711 TaxID=3156339 RepID=UPI003D2323F3
MKNFQELKNIVLTAETDAVKFYEKGNNTAGRRLRAAMQQIKQTANTIRVEVSKIKKS